jgi:hypothetical protein
MSYPANAIAPEAMSVNASLNISFSFIWIWFPVGKCRSSPIFIRKSLFACYLAYSRKSARHRIDYEPSELKDTELLYEVAVLDHQTVQEAPEASAA